MSSMPTRPAGHEFTILAVLILTLVLTALTAYQAQHAVRSHQDAAEAALREYAAFASWELSRKLEEATIAPLAAAVFHARLSAQLPSFAGAAPPDAAGSLARFRGALLQELAECACGESIRDFFALDLSAGTVLATSDAPSSEFREWLGSALLEHARAAAAGEQRSHVSGSLPPGAPVVSVRTRAPGDTSSPQPAGTSLTIISRRAGRAVEGFFVASLPDRPDARVVYAVLHDVHGAATGAYGFVVDVPSYVAPLARAVALNADVLPQSLTRGRPNSEVLAMRITAAPRHELYSSAGAGRPATVVVDTVESALAPLVTEVAIQPAMAGTLLIGGLPRSRLPLLLVLLAITLVLVGIGAIQLRRQHALARLRNDFVSGVSHELRTPLSQISMFAELLEDDRLDTTQRQKSIRIINEEVQRLRHLVENVLQFSHTGRGAQHFSPVPTDVSKLVHDVVESFAPLARSRDAKLDTAVAANLSARVDPHAIRQVLLNLLDNAVKYGPPGQSIRVRAARTSSAVRICVEDEGPGIPTEQRAVVWSAYMRLNRDIESTTAGSGIGLAVVHDLVTRHSGTVAIEDSPAGGARFVIDLPAGAAADSAARRAAPRMHTAATDLS
jgi:signal transduction histidine kinase